MREFTSNAHFHDAVIHDGYMYFSETTFNGLFRVKEEGGEAEFLGRFPEEDPWQGELHRALYLRENKIYFVPLNGRGISVYDIENNSFSMIWLVLNDNERARYCQTIDIDARILLIPAVLSIPFTIFHLEDEKIEFHREINKKILDKIMPPKDWNCFTVHSAILENNDLYLSIADTNVVLSLSLTDWTVNMSILSESVRVRCMSKINDSFWFTLMEHAVLRWIPETNLCDKIEIPGDAEDLNYPYFSVLKHGNSILLLAGREDKIWKLNDECNQWIECTENIEKGFQRDIKASVLFLGYRNNDTELMLFPRSGNGILKKNISEEMFYFIPVTYAAKFVFNLNQELAEYIVNVNQLHFEKDITLDQFLTGLISEKKERYDTGKRLYDNGKMIYKTACRRLNADKGASHE